MFRSDKFIRIPLWAALLPVAVLLFSVALALILEGADFVASYSYIFLLGATVMAVATAASLRCISAKAIGKGLKSSARQTLPAVPVLLLIGTISATWMLSGVVPLLIQLGMTSISAELLLVTSCCVCAFISLLTGSSWTTIATIGVAFMGIGQLFGYSPGWIAGAIISGAYFGDKISPLSDTTVLAATSSRVNLFSHIRYMLITTVPSIVLALGVFGTAGFLVPLADGGHQSHMVQALQAVFNLNHWILLIPAITMVLIILRINTIATLGISTLLGLAGIFIFQPHIVAEIGGTGVGGGVKAALQILLSDTSLGSGDASLDSLLATGGMKGMLPTILLIMSAMVFGGMMVGTGMLRSITEAFTSLIRNRVGAVGATVASGIFLNGATADQYLSIIIGSNMFGPLYERLGLEPRLLSRTVEDSVSVTSVLIPWNSCGVTQSAVLGVGTLTYLPYCVFNYLSPLMSVVIAMTGFKIVEYARRGAAMPASTASQASTPSPVSTRPIPAT